jgi:hypothetical protein
MFPFLLSLSIYAAISLGIASVWHYAFKWPWRSVLKNTAFNVGVYATCYVVLMVGRWIIGS